MGKNKQNKQNKTKQKKNKKQKTNKKTGKKKEKKKKQKQKIYIYKKQTKNKQRKKTSPWTILEFVRQTFVAGKCWTHLQMYCVIGEKQRNGLLFLSSPVRFIMLIIIELF